MTFVGSIEEGIHQDRNLMFTKSLMYYNIISIKLGCFFQHPFGFNSIYFESYLYPEY